MYKHILIPTDGSELSAKAATQGVQLAKSINARVTAVMSSPTFRMFAVGPVMVTDTPDQYEKECAARARHCLAEVAAKAKAAGVAYEGVHVVHDHPWEAIIDTATKKGSDLIFMASHGRKGLSALVIGSETTKVLTHTTIPTLVFR
jgi:nucleotide-binding universal stress UspA family protein